MMFPLIKALVFIALVCAMAGASFALSWLGVLCAAQRVGRAVAGRVSRWREQRRARADRPMDPAVVWADFDRAAAVARDWPDTG